MDHYRTLGIARTADATTVRNAYRTLAKRFHPDVSTEPDAKARFIAIAEAYQVLSDPKTRARYDRTLQRAAARKAQEQQRARTTSVRDERPRYNKSYSRSRHKAREQAEAQSRMGYAEFDRYAFASVAGYVAPKILGCVGIGVVAVMVTAALLTLASLFEVLLIVLFGLLPGIAYASTHFDAWHNERRARRNRR